MSWDAPKESGNKLNIFPTEYSPEEVNGYLTLSYYDKEKEARINEKSIEGVCIGRNTCIIDAFDTAVNKFYTSTMYQRKTDTITVYSGGRKEFEGTVEQVKDKIKLLGLKPRVRRLYVLITKDGFCSVKSHISCAIQLEKDSSFYKDEWKNFSYVFSPAKYDKKDFLDKSGKPLLSSAADKNNPFYVTIEKGRPITEEMLEKLNVKGLYDEFEAFIEQISSSNPIAETPSEPAVDIPATPQPTEPIDDLPF